jgi:DNA-binding XRE family transcriptional regulator
MDDKKQLLLYQQVGDRIKHLRTMVSLTQEQLADAVGLSRASIVNIEKGRQHPSLHLLFQIAECIQVNAHDLIPNEATINLADVLETEELKSVSDKDLGKLASFIQSHQ